MDAAGFQAIATNFFKEADLAEISTALPPAPQINFTQIRDRVTAALAPISRQPERSVNVELAISESNSFEKVTQSVIKASRSPDLATIPDSIPEIIDTEVTLMGYELSLLERIMRLLDFCFCDRRIHSPAVEWLTKTRS